MDFIFYLLNIIGHLFDFILHIDQYIIWLIEQYGNWIYLLLFLIIFIETGLVVMPFLPGDSLLFIVGSLAGVSLLDYKLASVILLVAAILGDQCNYHIGRYFGDKVFSWQSSKFFNRDTFDKAHNFYQEYGGATIFVARFMPFLRTFAPFVAGVAKMRRSHFTFYNIVGATVWVIGITALGYFFGQTNFVKNNLQYIIWALIIIPGLIVMFGHWINKNKNKN